MHRHCHQFVTVLHVTFILFTAHTFRLFHVTVACGYCIFFFFLRTSLPVCNGEDFCFCMILYEGFFFFRFLFLRLCSFGFVSLCFVLFFWFWVFRLYFSRLFVCLSVSVYLSFPFSFSLSQPFSASLFFYAHLYFFPILTPFLIPFPNFFALTLIPQPLSPLSPRHHTHSPLHHKP